MSHIPGHVDDPNGSFGTLILDGDKSITISFLPPPFPLKKGDAVGFHPIFNNDHTEIHGFNIAMWDVHEVAEEMAVQKLKGFKSIEEVHNMPNKKAGFELMISDGTLPAKYRDILRDALNYFGYNDFLKFYVKPNGKADAAYAEKQVIDFYRKKSVTKASGKKKK